MFFLPEIRGRFPVGVTTFVTPVQQPQTVGSIKLKRSRRSRQDQSEHALFLEEVAFTAYYPAEVNASSKKGVPWLIRPVRESLEGFSTFLGISKWLLWPVVYIYAAFVKIPAYPNSPLLKPTEQSQWPLVIFSHGLGGSRTAYSQFCSRVAASGKVVLAVEHRDGTGTICMPRSWNQGHKSEPKKLLYLRESDVYWDDDDDTASVHPLPLRGQQLAFRHHEIYITYTTFSRFLQGDPSLRMETIDRAPYDKESWVSLNKTGLECIRYKDRVMLAGHSFGGCTVLSILSTKPLDGHSPIPVERVVILDPWLEPLPIPGPAPFTAAPPSSAGTTLEEDINSSIYSAASNVVKDIETKPHPRILVINSETFTIWKDHYARLQEVVAQWEPNGGQILTIIGSVHVSFSDFPVLPLIRKGTARHILETINNLSSSFLDDKLNDTLHTMPTTSMEIEIVGVKRDGKPKRKLVGNIGDVIAQYKHRV